jgi:hypothetical protein
MEAKALVCKSEVLQKVLSIYQIDVELLAVPNSSLGPRITVTGLLFWEGIIEALSSSGCTEKSSPCARYHI